MRIDRFPPRAVLALCLLGSLVLGVVTALEEAPWEDELLSLRAADDLGGYRLIPLYFLYLRAGHAFGGDLAWLRLWSFLPWLMGLWWCHGLLAALCVRPGVALATVALLALDPFLVHECMCVRYYALFFATAVLALRAAVYLCDAPRTKLRAAAAFAALLLPQLTIYSAVALLAVLAVYACLRRPSWRAGLGWAAVGLVTCGLAWSALRLPFIGPAGGDVPLLARLPIQLGYERAPADWPALAFQYQQLLGWHYLDWLVPPRVVECAALLLSAAAIWWLARRTEMRHRALLVLVALVPLAVWAAALVVNALGTRYYTYAALPLALGCVSLLRSVFAASRVAGVALLLPSAAAIAISFAVPANPPLDRLAAEVERRQIRELAVIPFWYTATLGRYFELHRTPIRLLPWSDETAHAEPRWVFRKYPLYTWSARDRRRIPQLDRYRASAAFGSVKKYYFHGARVVDRLYERR